MSLEELFKAYRKYRDDTNTILVHHNSIKDKKLQYSKGVAKVMPEMESKMENVNSVSTTGEVISTVTPSENSISGDKDVIIAGTKRRGSEPNNSNPKKKGG